MSISFEELLLLHKVGEGRVHSGEAEHTYHTISATLPFSPPNFVGVQPFLFISDQVPEEYRSFMILHELIETGPALASAPGRCLAALMQELTLVPESIYIRYCQFRHQAFQDLVDFYQRRDHDPAFMVEIQNSLTYLKKLTAPLKFKT